MAHDLQQLFDLLARNSGKPDAWILRNANAAPKGQAKSIWLPEVNSWRPVHSRGLFEGFASPHAPYADLRLICNAQVTSASFLTLALNFSPSAVTTFRMVSKLGLRSPDKAL